MAIKYHCRCRVCQARQTRLKHPVRDYTRGPRCRGCGRINTLRVDKWMQNRWRTYRTCLCNGYWFPHRQGSLYCYHRADGQVRQFGEPDFKDREFSPA
jgi:hypothetical protein